MPDLLFNETNIEKMHGDNVHHYVRLAMEQAEKIEDPFVQQKQFTQIAKVANLSRVLQQQAIIQDNEVYDQEIYKQKVENDLEALKLEIESEKLTTVDKDSDLSPEEKAKAKLDAARKKLGTMFNRKKDD